MVNDKTLYGLIGRKLGHSFSAKFFNEKFLRENINAEYRNFEIPDITQISDILISHPELKGFNVTIPYKRDILPYLSSISPQAESIGAVNTVLVERHGDGSTSLHGFNTDAPGFRDSLRPLLPEDTSLKGLILGTGGASAAVACALEECGVAPTFVSRRNQHNLNHPCITYDDLDEAVMSAHRVIVNATPLGTYPDTDSAPPIPYHLITPRHICHDLVYNPENTRFMQLCARQGATVKNGYEMLLNQALAAYRIWTTGRES